VTTQDILIVRMPQIREFASGVQEISNLVKLNLFGCFELGCLPNSIYCGLVTTQNILISRVPQIGEFASGI